MRILIVDDDPQLLLILQAKLRKLGHRVEAAAGGEEALAKFRAEPYQLVVCDWQMPGMDGPTLCRALRAETRTVGAAALDVYVIMLTARNTPEAQVDGLHAGADDFLIKPVALNDLVASIRAAELVLAIKPAGGASAA
jgi:DNA-binding response OmpR family regulator